VRTGEASGKSTLLRVIAGLEPQTSGEVRIEGVSVDGVRPGARNLAMVFQSYALYPHLSCIRQHRRAAADAPPFRGGAAGPAN
jgi:multiple sugar transport system ATP-binding protein